VIEHVLLERWCSALLVQSRVRAARSCLQCGGPCCGSQSHAAPCACFVLQCQVDKVCDELSDMKELAGGFNMVGFSQGGQFLRVSIARCSRAVIHEWTCQACYLSEQASLTKLGCRRPTRDGHLQLMGGVEGLQESRCAHRVCLLLQHHPAAPLSRWGARRADEGIAPTVKAGPVCVLLLLLSDTVSFQAVVERCGHKLPPVHTLITLGGQHQGVANTPGTCQRYVLGSTWTCQRQRHRQLQLHKAQHCRQISVCFEH
jgi:hypothetical protein